MSGLLCECVGWCAATEAGKARGYVSGASSVRCAASVRAVEADTIVRHAGFTEEPQAFGSRVAEPPSDQAMAKATAAFGLLTGHVLSKIEGHLFIGCLAAAERNLKAQR